MLMGRYGALNQAGDGAPKTGPQSDLIKANLGRLFVQPVAVLTPHGFDGYLGQEQLAPGVDEGIVYADPNYHGDLPSAVQPVSARFAPWLEG